MNLVTPEASKVPAASMLLPASEIISGVCVCVCVCARAHVRTHACTYHSSQSPLYTVGRPLSKESLLGSVNLSYCGSSCPHPHLLGVGPSRYLCSTRILTPCCCQLKKDAPHTLPPSPREAGAQPCLLLDVEGTPHIPFRLVRQSGASPPADLCFLFCRWVVCLSPLSPVTKNYLQSKKKENSRKVPSSSSHRPECTSWLGCE